MTRHLVGVSEMNQENRSHCKHLHQRDLRQNIGWASDVAVKNPDIGEFT